MIARRDFLQIAVATAVVAGLGDRLGRAAAQGRIGQDDLLRFTPTGQLTLLHMADVHAQLNPLYHREPSLNLGVGAARGEVPHFAGGEMLARLAIPPASLPAYMLTSADYEALARTYGRVGGMDRLATLVAAIRAERGAERVLLLDGGDALQGSYTALNSRGGDMVEVMQTLGVEATTGHWEFTLGAERVAELFGGVGTTGSSGLAFLAGNVRDTDFEEPVFPAMRLFEKGGVAVAVIGQAFPYTPIANPRRMIPRWSFGIGERRLRASIAEARRQGAQVVVLLSHNGFDVDRKLAARVEGIDVILTAHTHDALPAPVQVGRTLLIASGASGKCLSRLDLEVADGRVTDFAYALIPVLADAIAPDPDMAALIARIRAPHAAMLTTELARTGGLLYRRDTFGGTIDQLICDAVMAERDAEIALSPGFRWGPTLLPGEAITWEDVYNATAITYPAAYRTVLTGAQLKAILEAVADNLFNPDPYLQQGGDMVRLGGLGLTVHVDAGVGQRISAMRLLRTDTPIEPDKAYTVAGWASVSEGIVGPPIWDVVAAHLKSHPEVTPRATSHVGYVRTAEP
jgi:S-sulfosulfanyl-L-cysteine sulfohydrolase